MYGYRPYTITLSPDEACLLGSDEVCGCEVRVDERVAPGRVWCSAPEVLA